MAVDGPVNAIAVDGDTVFLGGDFRHVNGQLRISLAAASLSTGALLPWAPKANVHVDALAVSAGQVYLGGAFTTITDGTGVYPAPYLARVSEVDGTLDQAWGSGVSLPAMVRSLLLNVAGTAIYVGGDFGPIGAAGYASRLTLLSTGTVAAIDPTFRSGPNNGTGRAPVYALALDGNTLLIGSGGSGGGCTLQDATTGVSRWSHHTNGNVVSVASLGPQSYCGGHFSGSNAFNGLTRTKIAEITTSTGAITAYAPSVNSALGIFALAASPTALFAGGDFTKVGSTSQPYFGFFADSSAVTAPPIVPNVSAIPGSGQVILTWDTPSTDGGAKITNYKIYRASSGKYTLLAKTANASFLDTAVANGTTYSYYIQALSSAGTGPSSATATATPVDGLVIAPPAPQAFAAVGTFGAAALSWSPPVTDGGTPLTAYQIYRGTDPASLMPLASVDPSTLAYPDSAVVIGTRYYYAVAAVTSFGTGVRSKQASAMPNSGVPSAPDLTAAPSATSVLLEWVPSPNSGASPVTKYILVRDGVRIANASSTTFEYTDTKVVAGLTYSYQVKAQNSYGSSKYSDAVAVTVG